MQVEVERHGVVEAVHEVAISVMDLEGRELLSTGEVDRTFSIRSSAKPFQAAVSQRLGAGLDASALALACASHEGWPVHVALVRRMLAEAGVDEGSLRCPPAWPLARGAAHLLAAQGERAPRRIWHRCSGKHAAMLRACAARGWESATYLEAGHPLQQAIAHEMEEVLGDVALPVGVDGCGVPAFRTHARSLAGGFARLAAHPGYSGVRTAMHRFPALVSGAGNEDTLVATWLQAVAKRGAEGCLGVAVEGRGGIGMKAWDGSSRPLGPALLAVLDRLGWIPHGVRPWLAAGLDRPVLGGGVAVGSVHAPSSWP